MPNTQIVQAIQEELDRFESGEVSPAESERLRGIFAEALTLSLSETRDAPESDDDFGERVIGNFIIMAGGDGHEAVSISHFLADLVPSIEDTRASAKDTA